MLRQEVFKHGVHRAIGFFGDFFHDEFVIRAGEIFGLGEIIVVTTSVEDAVFFDTERLMHVHVEYY